MTNFAKARVLALITPLALLAGAYGFQFIGGLVPCEMCWWQRYAHAAALGLAITSFTMGGQRAWIALSGVALALAALIGGFHAGVEYGWWKGFTECTATVKFGAGADPLSAIMAAPVIRCDVVQWKMFGISMAGYDFLVSGAVALAIFALLARKEKVA